MFVFLDFDGVLNTEASQGKWDPRDGKFGVGNIYLDEDCVTTFKELLSELKDVQIVISSSWRSLWSMSDLNILLNRYAIQSAIDKTGNTFDGVRGRQIINWLERNANKDDDYIVIDDDSYDIIPHIQGKKFIHCKDGFKKGLQADDIAAWKNLQ